MFKGKKQDFTTRACELKDQLEIALTEVNEETASALDIFNATVAKLKQANARIEKHRHEIADIVKSMNMYSTELSNQEDQNTKLISNIEKLFT